MWRIFIYRRRSGIDRMPTYAPPTTMTATTAIATTPTTSMTVFLSLVAVDNRFELIWSEIQIAAIPLVQIGRGIVVDDHTDVRFAVDVGVHRGDARRPALVEQVVCVGAPHRAQPNPAALAYQHPGDRDRVGLRAHRAVGRGIPPAHALGHLGNQVRRRLAPQSVQVVH